MSIEYFEEQRRQLIAAIRAKTDHVAAQIGKTALDERVLEQWPRCHDTSLCRSRSSRTLT